MKKPKVSIIMASSLDGKITLPNYEKIKFTSNEDKRFLMKMRSKYDCIVTGAITVRKGSSPTLSNRIKKDIDQPLNVLISTDLNFNVDKTKYFKDKKIKKAIFTTNNSPIKKRKQLGKVADLIIVSKDKNNRVDVNEVYKALIKKYNCKRILIEGGGLTNQSFIEKNIVDDIYLTLCPIIISDKKSRSFIEGSGLSKENVKKLKFLSCTKNKSNELFLHYQIIKNKKITWNREKGKWRLID